VVTAAPQVKPLASMAELTKSEQMFEKLCAARRIPFRRIPTSTLKSADYRLRLGGRTIVVEIKQLDPNADDQCLAKAWGTSNCPLASAPANRVQGLLKDGYKQIKNSAAGKAPAIIVVHNNAGDWNWIDAFTVSKAMFGSFGFVIGLDTNNVVRLLSHGYLGRRKVTANTFRSLSAVGVLTEGSITLYHNPFAINPMPSTIARRLAAAQYMHPDPHARGFVPWKPSRN